MAHTPFKTTPSLRPRGPLATHQPLGLNDGFAARDALGPLAVPARSRRPVGLRLLMAFTVGLCFALIGGITLGLAPSADRPLVAQKEATPARAAVAEKAVATEKGTVANAGAVPLLKTNAPVK